MANDLDKLLEQMEGLVTPPPNLYPSETRKTRDRPLEKISKKFEEELERVRRLQDLGQQPVDDRPQPCPTCHGAQFVKRYKSDHDPTAQPWEVDLVPCTDCGKRAEVEHNRNVASRRASGLQGFEHVTFDLTLPRPGQEEQWDIGMDYCYRPMGWLWIYSTDTDGNPSWYVGKTTLARCIANEWHASRRHVLFRKMVSLLDELRDGYNEEGEETYHALMQHSLDVPCLVLDDMFKEKETTWTREKTFQLTDHRMELGLPTVVTTNATMEQLEEQQPRLFRRVADTSKCTVIHFTNPPIEEVET
jgi:DNA replication protein DnaC